MSDPVVAVPNVGEYAVSGFGEPLRGTDPMIPNTSGAAITEPETGDTVPAVFDISGEGIDGEEVELWYQFTDPAGPVQTTSMTRTVRNGKFTFGGDTPSDPGEVDWWVASASGTSPKVHVTVQPAE